MRSLDGVLRFDLLQIMRHVLGCVLSLKNKFFTGALISLICPHLLCFGEEVVLSPEQQRRKDAAYAFLGGRFQEYFSTQARLVSSLNHVPGLRDKLEPAYLPTISADLMDLPRKLVVEGVYQRQQANVLLENLGFQPNGADAIWKTTDTALGVIVSSALDPEIIRKAFDSPEARQTPRE